MNPLFHKVSHSPRECKDALASSRIPVFIDLETTGLARRAKIVSVGVLVGGDVFILFVGSHELSVVPHQINLGQLREALAPLASPNLTAVFHNATFDVGFLDRAGVPVRCVIQDTAKLLKLADPDRGGDTNARWERRYRQKLNYRLKDIVLHDLDIRAHIFLDGRQGSPTTATSNTSRATCSLPGNCTIISGAGCGPRIGTTTTA